MSDTSTETTQATATEPAGPPPRPSHKLTVLVVVGLLTIGVVAYLFGVGRDTISARGRGPDAPSDTAPLSLPAPLPGQPTTSADLEGRLIAAPPGFTARGGDFTRPFDFERAVSTYGNPQVGRTLLRLSGYLAGYQAVWDRGDLALSVMMFAFNSNQGAEQYHIRVSNDDARSGGFQKVSAGPLENANAFTGTLLQTDGSVRSFRSVRILRGNVTISVLVSETSRTVPNFNVLGVAADQAGRF